MSRSPRLPRRKIALAVSVMQSAGLCIGSVKFHPDGTIEILTVATAPAEPANDFDRAEALGIL